MWKKFVTTGGLVTRTVTRYDSLDMEGFQKLGYEDIKKQKMKLVYFDIYGKAEPIRMALWKAGIEYEDVRLNKEGWLKYKDEKTLEFG